MALLYAGLSDKLGSIPLPETLLETPSPDADDGIHDHFSSPVESPEPARIACDINKSLRPEEEQNTCRGYTGSGSDVFLDVSNPNVEDEVSSIDSLSSKSPGLGPLETESYSGVDLADILIRFPDDGTVLIGAAVGKEAPTCKEVSEEELKHLPKVLDATGGPKFCDNNTSSDFAGVASEISPHGETGVEVQPFGKDFGDFNAAFDLNTTSTDATGFQDSADWTKPASDKACSFFTPTALGAESSREIVLSSGEEEELNDDDDFGEFDSAPSATANSTRRTEIHAELAFPFDDVLEQVCIDLCSIG